MRGDQISGNSTKLLSPKWAYATLVPTRSTKSNSGRADLQKRASGRDYDRVFERRQQKASFFALDRYGDDDVGALAGSMAYVSRKDAARHLQVLRRSLTRSCLNRPLILEAGCGTGGYLQWMAGELSAFAVGFDASPVGIAAARKRIQENGNVHVFVGDVRSVPLRDGVVGGAIALDLLHLVANRQAALRSLRDALAPGATLLFSVLQPDDEAENELASWRRDLEGSGYGLAALRDLSASWQEHMLAKHLRRWSRRQRYLTRLGRWVEPELQVSSAMLGVHGDEAVARATRRYEFEVVRDA